MVGQAERQGPKREWRLAAGISGKTETSQA
jgi:hypothetical protein